MSESCRRGYKCMCFQCGEKDCEKYEPEPPRWVKELWEDEQLLDAIKEASERMAKRKKYGKH